MSNIKRRDPGGYGGHRGAPAPGAFYYSSRGTSAAPSPSQHSYRSEPVMHTPRGRGGMDPRAVEEQTPSYYVEHLATFAVGRQFGLVAPVDGIRKLKQMEKSSAIWAQPMILRLRQNMVSVENDNGELVEQFPLELVEQPTAQVSADPRDAYNNILLFVVREDHKGRKNTTPTEMHIFQCNRVSASDLAEDLQHYIRGQFKKVRNGRRSAQTGHYPAQGYTAPYPDDVSVSSEGSEMFERDVNTLNRCFDDIERFVARTQSAALAQRELEQQAHRYRTAQRRDRRAAPPDPHGILQMRAQLPLEPEFVDIFRKFKLSFNLLAKLRNHIHEPNAPELVHFLFTPLSVVLDASHWGIGRNIATQVVSPLLSLEARELMQNCLTSKETDIWMSLGEAWRTPPEDWPGSLPPAYRPVFLDGFAPYGPPEPRQPRQSDTIRRGESEPPAPYRPRERERTVDTAPSTPVAQRYATQQRKQPQRNLSVDNINTFELDRISLEKERMAFEKEKLRERERRLEEEDRRLRQEQERLRGEAKMIEEERRRTHSSSHPGSHTMDSSVQPSPVAPRRHEPIVQNLPAPISLDVDQSPRQKNFVQDVINRSCKLVQATYDRIAQNQKELTVSRGEYLEVLNDTKNWWECKNMHNRVGYVPHTILTVVPLDGSHHDTLQQEEIYVGPAATDRFMNGNGGLPNGRPQMSPPREMSHRMETQTIQDAGVQTRFYQVNQAPVPPPPPPQILVPPTPTMREQINTVKLNKVAQPSAAETDRERQKARMILNRREDIDQVTREFNDTLTRNNGRALQQQQPRVVKSSVRLTEQTNEDDVQKWLREKGFSIRLMELLERQDGAALFSLSKPVLERAAGKEEGARLYSQLLVEKSRSNYQTKSRSELQAILKHRKTHVELSNEAAGEEPVTLPAEAATEQRPRLS